MDPDTQRLLDEGIASLRIGNKEEARRKLMQVINADERNEYAWLYLSEAVDSDEDRQICLENVLTINPANEQAETQLKAIEEEKARGHLASAALVGMLGREPITLKSENFQRGKFGRILGTLYVDGVNINELMVEEGHAEAYEG